MELHLRTRRGPVTTASRPCGDGSVAKYPEHFDEMHAIGVTYVPVVLSCYGRWHADSAVTLERVCQQAARRLGIADHRPILRRAQAAAGVAIWRRAAAMARACLPAPSAEAMAALFGDVDGEDADV